MIRVKAAQGFTGQKGAVPAERALQENPGVGGSQGFRGTAGASSRDTASLTTSQPSLSRVEVEADSKGLSPLPVQHPHVGRERNWARIQPPKFWETFVLDSSGALQFPALTEW